MYHTFVRMYVRLLLSYIHLNLLFARHLLATLTSEIHMCVVDYCRDDFCWKLMQLNLCYSDMIHIWKNALECCHFNPKPKYIGIAPCFKYWHCNELLINAVVYIHMYLSIMTHLFTPPSLRLCKLCSFEFTITISITRGLQCVSNELHDISSHWADLLNLTNSVKSVNQCPVRAYLFALILSGRVTYKMHMDWCIRRSNDSFAQSNTTVYMWVNQSSIGSFVPAIGYSHRRTSRSAHVAHNEDNQSMNYFISHFSAVLVQPQKCVSRAPFSALIVLCRHRKRRNKSNRMHIAYQHRRTLIKKIKLNFRLSDFKGADNGIVAIAATANKNKKRSHRRT